MKSVWHACGPLVLLLTLPGALLSAEPPSVPGIDAPELAHLGTYAVGYRTLHLAQPDQVDMLAPDGKGGFGRKDRVLDVDIWYPVDAAKAGHLKAMTYSGSLTSEPPALPTKFTVAGIAVRDAQEAAGAFPLVVVSHGYANVTVAMSWLTENIASKGYVVAAIRHLDGAYGDPAGFPQALLRRPLDIAFVTSALQSTYATQLHLDAARVAFVGYSMGGYGVLGAGGATFDLSSGAGKLVAGIGGKNPIAVSGLRAIVAMAPAGGAPLSAWGETGLQSIHVPLFLIAGDTDQTVNYQANARTFFQSATGSERYLLTFRNGGHAIGLNPAPAEMHAKLWDQDWFEDPVWRKSRLNAINLHFITAFLDRYVKDDASRAAYLDVRVIDSMAGAWPASPATAYAAYSPDSGDVTVWKGFQRKHAVGLELLKAKP